MRIRLSERLTCVADEITAYKKETHAAGRGALTMIDVGCDHALLPVYLIKEGIVQRAVASDIREGPLANARKNAAAYGVEDQMHIVISDGLQRIREHGDVLTICGLGGESIARILTYADLRAVSVRRLILAPQSKIRSLRAYLRAAGFTFVREHMVREENHYYPVIVLDAPYLRTDSQKDPGETEDASPAYTGAVALLQRAGVTGKGDAYRIADRFGPCLLSSHDPVLFSYLRQQKETITQTLAGMQPDQNDDASALLRVRLEDVEKALACQAPEKRLS
ncbi:MAG: SAM-dependent methyltransferase [Lachnospiraceae bacterium]|nr:SAM-dependent methyltransferase [Lachnospiraceae bacterium]